MDRNSTSILVGMVKHYFESQIKSKSGEKDSKKLRRDIGYLSEPGEDVEKKIKVIFQNSLEFNHQEYIGKMDLIFIV